MVNEIFSSSMWSMEFNELGEMVSVNWSDEFRAMLGYRNETDFPNVLESWSDLLHEEDKEHVLAEFYGAISDYTGKKAYSVEYRLLTRDRGLHLNPIPPGRCVTIRLRSCVSVFLNSPGRCDSAAPGAVISVMEGCDIEDSG